MNLFSIRDYFESFLELLNLDLIEEKRLNNKELQFLVECCVLNYEGIDLRDFSKLWKHFKGIKFVTTRNDLSVYKLKLGAKNWIKGKRNVFKLPPHLDIKKADDGFLVIRGDERRKVKKLSHSKEIVLEFGKEEEK